MDFKKLSAMRAEYNSKCLALLKEMLEKHPDIRFNQLMFILNSTEDHFNEEPDKTYERWYDRIKEIEKTAK